MWSNTEQHLHSLIKLKKSNFNQIYHCNRKAEERKVDVEVNHKKAISIFHKGKVSDVYNYKSGDNQKTIRKKSLEN